MDRFAVFVDAGYLLAAGGKVVCGTSARPAFLFDARGFLEMLIPRLQEQCGLRPLRTYWYDGARDGIPSARQQEVAALPNVKLRLGRLNFKNQQKGVDALIYHDLITLASTRAIADAYLLSGDEDLREGVRAAQERGIRLTLIGVDEPGERNQSRELCNEVDENIALGMDDIRSFFTLHSSPVAADASASQVDPGLSQIESCGRKFGEKWRTSATSEELDALRAEHPKIPRNLDMELVFESEHALQFSFRNHDPEKRALRRGFWSAIDDTSQD